MGGVMSSEFDQLFDRFQHSAFRLETRQQYLVPGEEERIRAWREGRPRPERSPRTSPWLRRVAETTAAGKRWQRVHVVDLPLSWYLRYQLVGYDESAAAGEQIRLADRRAHPDLAGLDEDFWLLDGDDPERALAVFLDYDADGRFLGFRPISDPAVLRRCREQRDLALEHSVPLADFTAGAAAG
jgi:hypothetical protein